jgi:hypothetical protein
MILWKAAPAGLLLILLFEPENYAMFLQNVRLFKK